jgi:hypothetical protein
MSEEINRFADRLFAPIGRFVVSFENLCHELRVTGIRIFEMAGLKKSELAEITFAGLTASPLLEVIVSLISQSFDLSSEQANKLGEIRKRAENLISIRNRVIHSTWHLIDFADIDHGVPDGVLVSKRRKRTGLDTQMSSLNKEELEHLSEEVKDVSRMIREFSLSLMVIAPPNNSFNPTPR